MIAEYQVYFAVQTIKYLGPFGGSSQTEITQVEYGVIGLDYSVPVLNQRLVHLVYVLEWAVAESDYVGMVEMRIGREERVLGVEFVVHVFFTNLDSWRGEANFLQTLQRFGGGLMGAILLQKKLL